MISLDTNIFVYAVDSADPVKQDLARSIAEKARDLDAAIGLQVCGEFYAVVVRKMDRAPWEAAQAARNLMRAYPTFAADAACVERALAEAASGRFSYWDATLLAAADQAGYKYLISEDMTDGAMLGGVEVVHPFTRDALSARASALLAGEELPEP